MKNFIKLNGRNRLIVSIVLFSISALVLICLMACFAIMTEIALGYRLLMIAPCIVFVGVLIKLLIGEINSYKDYICTQMIDSKESNID